jgi:type VI protein secretion system component Hcp
MSMFLDIPGIPGETQSINTNWNQKIMIQNMSYHVGSDTRPVAGHSTKPKPSTFGPMSFSKEMDKSTPKLAGMIPSGNPIPVCYIRVSRPGGATVGTSDGLFEAETYTLKNVYVKSYHTSGALGPGGMPMESWAITFTSIAEVYQTVQPGTGGLQAKQVGGWDVAANTKVAG